MKRLLKIIGQILIVAAIAFSIGFILKSAIQKYPDETERNERFSAYAEISGNLAREISENTLIQSVLDNNSKITITIMKDTVTIKDQQYIECKLDLASMKCLHIENKSNFTIEQISAGIWCMPIGILLYFLVNLFISKKKKISKKDE